MERYYLCLLVAAARLYAGDARPYNPFGLLVIDRGARYWTPFQMGSAEVRRLQVPASGRPQGPRAPETIGFVFHR